jgi:cytochrome c-type biogenesis protein CcmH/NrfG
MQDYYETLQVHPKADQEAIRAAYERLCSRYNPAQLEGAADELVELARRKRDDIERAYAILSDPQRRSAYDVEHAATAGAAPEQASNIPERKLGTEDVLDYSPLPPARRQERPRGFNAQPYLAQQQPSTHQGGRQAQAPRPLWVLPAILAGVLGLVIVVISVIITDGGMLGRERQSTNESGAVAAENNAQAPIATPTTEELMRAIEGQIVAARQVTQQAPDNPNAWITLGNALYDSMQILRERAPDSAIYIEDLPRWIEASDAYSKALELDPEQHAVRADLAACLCYYGTGVNDQSFVARGLEQVQQAAQADSTDERVLLNLGVCLIADDPPQTQEALESWRKILGLPSPDPNIVAAANQLIAQYE